MKTIKKIKTKENKLSTKQLNSVQGGKSDFIGIIDDIAGFVVIEDVMIQ